MLNLAKVLYSMLMGFSMLLKVSGNPLRYIPETTYLRFREIRFATFPKQPAITHHNYFIAILNYDCLIWRRYCTVC